MVDCNSNDSRYLQTDELLAQQYAALEENVSSSQDISMSGSPIAPSLNSGDFIDFGRDFGDFDFNVSHLPSLSPPQIHDNDSISQIFASLVEEANSNDPMAIPQLQNTRPSSPNCSTQQVQQQNCTAELSPLPSLDIVDKNTASQLASPPVQHVVCGSGNRNNEPDTKWMSLSLRDMTEPQIGSLPLKMFQRKLTSLERSEIAYFKDLRKRVKNRRCAQRTASKRKRQTRVLASEHAVLSTQISTLTQEATALRDKNLDLTKQISSLRLEKNQLVDEHELLQARLFDCQSEKNSLQHGYQLL
jgi:hypothetical protein